MSPAPLTEELRDTLQRVETALRGITVDDFFGIMIVHYTKQQECKLEMIITDKIREAFQMRAALMAANLECRGLIRDRSQDTPFDGPEVVNAKQLLGDIFDDEGPDDEDPDVNFCNGGWF